MSVQDKVLIEAGHLTYLTLLKKENSALKQEAANQKQVNVFLHFFLDKWLSKEVIKTMFLCIINKYTKFYSVR